jgi:hypothetical protein
MPESVDANAALKMFIESMGALGVLCTILFSTFSSIEASHTRRDQTKATEAALKQAKLERSVDYCRRWNDESLGLARDLVRKHYRNSNDPLSQQEFAKQLNGSPEVNRSFIYVLSFFGEISEAIDMGIIFEDIVQRSFDNTFTRIFELALPWMETEVPLLRRDLDKLYQRWRIR